PHPAETATWLEPCGSFRDLPTPAASNWRIRVRPALARRAGVSLIHGLAVCAVAGAAAAATLPIASARALAIGVAALALAVPLAPGVPNVRLPGVSLGHTSPDPSWGGRLSGIARQLAWRLRAPDLARSALITLAVGALAATHAASARDAVLAPPLGVWFAGHQPRESGAGTRADAGAAPGAGTGGA